jgi:hypothetical protein
MRVYDSLTTGNLSIQNTTTGVNASGVRFLNRGVTGNIFEVYGTYGNLLTVDDDLTDSIFSINSSAGLPVFDVYSNNSVYAGQYGQYDFVITGNCVGIGLSTPTAKLHVQGTNVTTNAQFCNSVLGSIFQRNNTATSGARNGITLRSTNLGTASSIDLGIGIGFELGYGGTVGSTLGTRVPAGYITLNQQTNADWSVVANRFTYMQFATLNAGTQTEAMRILANGNVGINETSPAAKLHVTNTGTGLALSFGNSVANNALFINTYGGAQGIGMDQTTAGIRLVGDYANAANVLVDIGYYSSGTVAHANWVSRFKVLNNGNTTCGGTITSTFSGNLTGNVTGNVSGTAGSETLSTVTGRGASTSTQISVGTSSSGSMYTGIKSGAGYSDAVSGATFKSITDHPTGGSFAFAAYYSGPSGPNSFYVAANGGAYFAQGVGIGITPPLQALHINGNLLLDGTTNGYSQSATRGIGYGSNSGGVSVNGFSGMDIQSVNAPAPNNGSYSQNVRFWAHHYGLGTGASPRMFIQYDGNVGIANVAPIQKLHVTGNSVFGDFGSNTYKTNLYLSLDAAADETWIRIYLPQNYASAYNGGTVKVRVLWAGNHATFGEVEEYQISYKTYYPSPYLAFSKVFCRNKTTDFGGGTYYVSTSTPDVVFYSNADDYLYVKIKGYHATYNLTRFVEAEVYGRTTATPTIAVTSGPATPTELSKSIQFSPQEGNIFATGCVGVGTANIVRPLTVNGDGSNPCIRLLNSSFATSTNTALYTFRGWLPIDIGATKYYLQVFN